MLRTVGWISWIFLYLIGLFPMYLRTKALRTKGKREEFVSKRNYWVGKWARTLLRNVGVKVEVTGAENLPPKGTTAVFVANHQSFLDIPILLANLDEPHGLLSKAEIGKIPLLRGWMGLLDCVYVDRDDMRSGIEALKKAEKVVAEGNSFTIFPEGTRSKDGSVAEFKAGAFRIATKAGVPLVPVAIDGSYKGLEYNGFRLKRCTVKLTILPMVETAGLSRPEQKALPCQLEEAVRGVLETDK